MTRLDEIRKRLADHNCHLSGLAMVKFAFNAPADLAWACDRIELLEGLLREVADDAEADQDVKLFFRIEAALGGDK